MTLRNGMMAVVGWIALLTSHAYAGEAFDDDVVHFSPVSPVLGGETVRVHVLALDADGAPRSGLGATPIGGGGRAADWSEQGNGWYSFSFTADRDANSGSVRLRGAVSGKLSLMVIPQKPARLSISGDPSMVVVGGHESSVVSVEMPGFPGTIDLQARLSSGEMTELLRSGDTTWTANLRPPQQNYPHLGLITVSSPGGVAVGGGAVGFRGAVAFPVEGPPGASISMKVGERIFGPITVGETGKAQIPIEVPPGIQEAVQIIDQGNQHTEKALNLAPPATRRLAWLPSPGPIPMGQNGILYLLVLKPDGQPDAAAAVSVEVSGGAAGRPTHIGGGLYAVDYMPTSDGEGELRASLSGSPIDTDRLQMVHLPSMPTAGLPSTSGGAVAAVLLLPKQEVVAPGRSTRVQVVAVDRYGYPVPEVELMLTSSLGTAPTKVITGGTGIAEFAWVASSSGAMSLRAEAGNGVVGTTSLLCSTADLSVSMPEWTGMLKDWRERLGTSSAAPAEEPEPPREAEALEDPKPEGKKQVPPPLTDSDASPIPALRVRLGGVLGSYTYAQIPGVDPGPLIPARFSIGGDGAGAASIQGGEVDARMWFLPYLGAHITGRAVQYAFATELFADPISDWISHGKVHLNARFPLEFGGGEQHPTQLWAGVHGGLEAGDFLTFKGCLEPGCQVNYATNFVPAFDFGADVGMEAGPVYAIGSFSQGLAGGRVPHRFSFDVEAGYELNNHLFVGLGLGSVIRKIAIEGASSGEEFGGIVDEQWFGRLSVGVQY